MNKTQKRKEVTKRFLIYVEETFPSYYTDDDGFGGYISLVPTEFKGHQSDNYISYHRSYFSLIVLDEACGKVKQDCKKMNKKLVKIITELELI
jgi:hypothetical protein